MSHEIYTGVVIVTYADRRNLLERVVQKLLMQLLIRKILIVGNQTTYNLKEFINKFHDERIESLSFADNTGSAAAYKAGILFYKEVILIDHIWLLDDDNLPDDLCFYTLNKLINQYPTEIFLPLRKDREYLKKSIHGISSEFLFPQRNSFLGFHVFVFLKKKLLRKKVKLWESLKDIYIPMAPYGGLFFNKNFLEVEDLPNELLYLYGDDFIFTFALVSKGKKIRLLSNITIQDIDESWINKHTSPGIKYLFQHDFRSWFSARNAAYFSKYFLRKSKFMFWLNKSIYLLSLSIISKWINKQKEFKRFKEMVDDGLNQNFDNKKILNWKHGEDVKKNL